MLSGGNAGDVASGADAGAARKPPTRGTGAIELFKDRVTRQARELGQRGRRMPWHSTKNLYDGERAGKPPLKPQVRRCLFASADALTSHGRTRRREPGIASPQSHCPGYRGRGGRGWTGGGRERAGSSSLTRLRGPGGRHESGEGVGCPRGQCAAGCTGGRAGSGEPRARTRRIRTKIGFRLCGAGRGPVAARGAAAAGAVYRWRPVGGVGRGRDWRRGRRARCRRCSSHQCPCAACGPEKGLRFRGDGTCADAGTCGGADFAQQPVAPSPGLAAARRPGPSRGAGQGRAHCDCVTGCRGVRGLRTPPALRSLGDDAPPTHPSSAASASLAPRETMRSALCPRRTRRRRRPSRVRPPPPPLPLRCFAEAVPLPTFPQPTRKRCRSLPPRCRPRTHLRSPM